MDWKSIVKTVAPAIGTALGGPLGGMATMAIAEVILPAEEVQQLKNSPSKLDKAVEQAVISGSPETLQAIQEANHKFEERMAELGVDLEKIHAEDRDSARKRQAETGDMTPAILAYLYLVGFFGVVVALFMCGDDLGERTVGILQFLLGALLTCVTGSKDYYFGSSSSSAQKNVLLQRTTAVVKG